MNFESNLKAQLSAAMLELYGFEVSPEALAIQPTKKEFEGSHTFVVFPYLKVARQKPEEMANALGVFVKEGLSFIAGYNVVKGFLNFKLTDGAWINVLNDLSKQNDYGRVAPTGQKVMVEFSSPNTNKPLHLGHLRNNFLGDSMSRILAFAGYHVMKTNLVNDRGIHICKSMLAYERFGAGETPESAGIKGDHLIGQYYVKFDQAYKGEVKELVSSGVPEERAKKEAPLMLAAQEMLKRWEAGDKETVALWEKMNGWVYDGFDETYKTMGIVFDKIYKESDTYLLGKNIVEEGLEKGVFFLKDDGSVWVDLAGEGLDEKLVLRSDGTAVYMTQDMGTCDHKYEDFPFDRSVYVVGNEQDYHFKVLFSIMKKIGRNYADGLHHLSYGMVDLPSGKMKSREGTVVDADDLMQEMFDTAEQHTRELGKIEGMEPAEAEDLYHILGLGALKYFLLKVDPRKRILFDPKESVEFQGNTGPFIQYTHARISAILRRAKALDLEQGSVLVDLPLNQHELEVIATLSKFPEVIVGAAKAYSPAAVAQYVYDLAKAYNAFYQEVPIFNEERSELVQLRVAISAAVARVIKTGMGLLGINVPERM